MIFLNYFFLVLIGTSGFSTTAFDSESKIKVLSEKYAPMRSFVVAKNLRSTSSEAKSNLGIESILLRAFGEAFRYSFIRNDHITFLLFRAFNRGGVIGAIAGFVQVITLMWLRTAINYQYRYGVSLDIALKELYRQGGIGRFYNGVFYALIQGPLAKFGSIAANEGSKVLVDHYFKDSRFSDSLSSAFGATFSTLWRITLMPIETCKTVLQVDGVNGFHTLLSRCRSGEISILYQGSTTVALLTAVGHYPWFFTHNSLDRLIDKPDGFFETLFRSAFIGFVASAISDSVSNCIRVIKTVKQSMAIKYVGDFSYQQVINKIMNEGGIQGLFFRGLTTRIIGNGIQSIVFTIVWKILIFYEFLKFK